MDTHVNIICISYNCVYKPSKDSLSVIIKVSLSHILSMLYKLSSLNQSNKYIKNISEVPQIELYACYLPRIRCVDNK